MRSRKEARAIPANAPTVHSNLRRLDQVWAEPQIYLVTACTHRRRRLLATEAMARAVFAALCASLEQWPYQGEIVALEM